MLSIEHGAQFCSFSGDDTISVPTGPPYIDTLADRFALGCIPHSCTDSCILDELSIENLAQKGQAGRQCLGAVSDY